LRYKSKMVAAFFDNNPMSLQYFSVQFSGFDEL
jgi:hypothetical protein